MSTLSEKERHELSLLLPWYANGTLDDAVSRKVEDALAHDDALAREFELVLEDQAAMVELVSEEEVPISIEERFTAALHSEQNQPAAHVTPRETGESVIRRVISTLFSDRPRANAFAAAVFVLAVPTFLVISGVLGNQQAGQYQTASGEEETDVSKTRMLVKFRSEVAWTDIDVFLKENRGQVVKGPNADGLYELEFEKVEKLDEKLGAEIGLFEFALPAN